MSEGQSSPAPAPPAASPRLMSLDALRGFDMFWIIGAEDLFHALYKMSDQGIIRMLAICAALLIGYWALMTFVPFPDVRQSPGSLQTIEKETGFTNVTQLNLTSTNVISGVFIKGVNLANYLDQKYLPGKNYDGTWDPEGLLSTLPAVATCLLGVFAGLLLKSNRIKPSRKADYLLLAGLVGVLLGHL